MLLIYTHRITNRIKYTFDLIFKHLSGIEYELTTDIGSFTQHGGAKLSYTLNPISNELFFKSGDLLFEEGIRKEAIDIAFPSTISDLPSDPFSYSFLLASRYEEYLPFVKDKYGRFSAEQSLGYKNNFLQKPVINIWTKKIQEKILKQYPDFIFPKKKYSYIPTIDIDNAYAFEGKNILRTLGGYARAITKTDPEDFLLRTKVLSGKEKDPFDTYELQLQLHKKYNLHPIYFFLLGDWSENDKNIPHSNSKIIDLIQKLSLSADAGIHPSFASNTESEKVKMEKKRLEKIKDAAITKSRQHFLMLRFPDTYKNIIDAGITDDYTMGFADAIGFRAGICSPYKHYDLPNEKETNLTIHPFAVMDGTLNSYMKLSPEEGIEKVKEIVNEIKNVNGEFITIWHNESLSDWREWKGWQYAYERILKEAHPDLPTSLRQSASRRQEEKE